MDLPEHMLLPPEVTTTVTVITHLQKAATIQRGTTADDLMARLGERVHSSRSPNLKSLTADPKHLGEASSKKIGG